jgi:hypothetical protein
VADLDPLPATFGTLVSQTEFINTDQVAGAIQLSMWKPDFFLFQNISPWNLPKALHPETMQNKYHVLLSVWTEVCKFLLVQFGMFEPFGVGWVFDSEYDYETGGESIIAAAYQKHDGQHWLLLNPIEIERFGYGENVSFRTAGDRFKLSKPGDIERLVTYAVHEITHMQGISSHTDAYASAITANMQAVFRIAPVLKKVVKEARASVRAARKAAKRTSRPKTKAYATWEEAGPENWLLKRSDGKYVARVIRQFGGDYSLYLAEHPDKHGFAGRFWGTETNVPSAKRLLEMAARKQFPLRDKSREERLIWDPYEASTYTYGTRAKDHRTVVSVRINNDDMFVPRAWVESTQEWTEGWPLKSFEQARDAAEELYAQVAS